MRERPKKETADELATKIAIKRQVRMHLNALLNVVDQGIGALEARWREVAHKRSRREAAAPALMASQGPAKRRASVPQDARRVAKGVDAPRSRRKK